MNLLLDTHAFIWFVENDKQLPAKVKSEIENEENSIYLSVVSFWEITIKHSLGKISLNSDIEQIIQEAVDNGFNILSLDAPHFIELDKLSFHHRDPFDRMIISQGMVEDFTVVSKDNDFGKYSVSLLWN